MKSWMNWGRCRFRLISRKSLRIKTVTRQVCGTRRFRRGADSRAALYAGTVVRASRQRRSSRLCNAAHWLGNISPCQGGKHYRPPHAYGHYIPAGETAALVRDTKARGGRVIAVGTTSCRTLEGSYQKLGAVRADSGETNIFIYPDIHFM